MRHKWNTMILFWKKLTVSIQFEIEDLNLLIIKHKSFSYAHTEEYEQFYKFSKIHYILTFCGVKSDVESVMLILVNIFCKKDAKIIESKANLKTIIKLSNGLKD